MISPNVIHFLNNKHAVGELDGKEGCFFLTQIRLITPLLTLLSTPI